MDNDVRGDQESSSTSRRPTTGRDVRIRDVYKCSFLKLVEDGKGKNKKRESNKYWVIFTVANEIEPSLEFFAERHAPNKQTPSPVLSYSLKNCVHISPSITVDESKNKFEFAITLENRIVRLISETRELMDEWIDGIRNKLRALDILTPKDNYYVKDPVNKWNRISNIPSTRPLPPIPTAQEEITTGISIPASMDLDAFTRPASTPDTELLLDTFYTDTQFDSLYEPIFTSSTPNENSSTQNGRSSRQNRALLNGELGTFRCFDDERGDSSPLLAHSSEITEINGPSKPLSLRESQVLKLQKEIAHRAGVRVMVRKRDSQDSIAFVDWMGAVFVGGWKQKQYPQLHNTFHIGDILLSVCGQHIKSASEAYKLIKQQPLIVEMLLQRIPYGKVFIIRREYEGQELGLVREGNTAEVLEVIPDGLVERAGLENRAVALDSSRGLETNWTITEINNRSLNLFFKGNEVKDRLNAVGKDISILFQPSDLVKQLKKSLKSFKGYRDYIVQ